MPITAEEKAEIEKSVLSLTIHEFNEDFEVAFILADEILGGLPDRAAEEIRNADNHKALALKATEYAVGMLNVERARRHILYAKHITLIQAVAHQISYLTEFITEAERIPPKRRLPAARNKLQVLRQTRREIRKFDMVEKKTIPELQADNSALIARNNSLEGLLADANLAIGELHAGNPTARPVWGAIYSRMNVALFWVIHNLVWLGPFAVFLNVVAAIVFVMWWEDQAKVWKVWWYGPPEISQPVGPAEKLAPK